MSEFIQLDDVTVVERKQKTKTGSKTHAQPKKQVQLNFGTTSAGRSMDWYVEEQAQIGNWVEQEIPAEVVGLSRPLKVFRSQRKTNLITYDWHGDTETFCPPIWWGFIRFCCVMDREFTSICCSHEMDEMGFGMGCRGSSRKKRMSFSINHRNEPTPRRAGLPPSLVVHSIVERNSLRGLVGACIRR